MVTFSGARNGWLMVRFCEVYRVLLFGKSRVSSFDTRTYNDYNLVLMLKS